MSVAYRFFCCGKPPAPEVVPPEKRRGSVLAGDIQASHLSAVEGENAQRLGYFSNHGWERKKLLVGKSDQIVPKINQDRILISPSFAGNDDAWVLGCYDGNGTKGEQVAEMAAFEIVEALAAKKNPDNMSGSLIQAFKIANDNINKKAFSTSSGSTATVVHVQGAKVHCANVGDSKACRIVDTGSEWASDAITKPHLPTTPDEKTRIESMGGHVLDDQDNLGAARVFDNPDPLSQIIQMQQLAGSMSGGMGGMGGMGAMAGGMADMGGSGNGSPAFMSRPWPGLAMSRVLGHKGVESIGIIPTPDIVNFSMTASDKALVVASDGVWDFVKESEAVAVIKKHAPNGPAACKELVQLASKRWEEDDPTYRDDVSCLVVYWPLNGALPEGPPPPIYKNDSEVAVENQRQLEADISAIDVSDTSADAPPPGPGSAASLTAQEQSALEKAAEQARGGLTADQLASKKKMIKASKEQRRRSVNVNFG